MEDKEKPSEKTGGEMHKRKETMADGVRYIIFYTFGDEQKKNEVAENV